MKILYISPSFPNDNQKAADVRANQLLKRLSQQVDLHVFGFCDSQEPINKKTHIRATIVKKSEMTPGKFLMGTLTSTPRAFLRYTSPAIIKNLENVLHEFKPDIVHFDSIGTLVLLGVVENKCSNAKKVFHIHDSVTKIYQSRTCAERGMLGALNSYIEGKKIQRIESEVYDRGEICLVDSQADAEFLRKLNADNKVKVLPLGFDKDSFSTLGTVTHLAKPNIVFSGAMNGSQSLNAVLLLLDEIMPLIWDVMPDVTVYVVGANPPSELLERQNNRVVVTGFVEDMGGYLRAADVYVSPMRIGSGMRTRMVEALACGCSVLATSMAMQGIWVNGMGELKPWLEAETPQKFASAYLDIMSKPDKRSELSLSASHLVEKWYSWDTVTNQLVQYYEEIV